MTVLWIIVIVVAVAAIAWLVAPSISLGASPPATA
jgi:hypothetical protein